MSWYTNTLFSDLSDKVQDAGPIYETHHIDKQIMKIKEYMEGLEEEIERLTKELREGYNECI